MTLPEVRPSVKAPLYLLTIVVLIANQCTIGEQLSKKEVEDVAKLYNIPLVMNDNQDYESLIHHSNDGKIVIITCTYVFVANLINHE